MINTFMLLLADAQPAPAGQQPQGGFDTTIFILIIPFMLLAYLFFIRPARQQEKEKQALLGQMKKNDKVITHAGIYGKIVSVAEKEDEITVEIDDKVRVKMVKNAILRNLTNEETLKEAEAAKKAAKDAAKGGKPAEQPASTAVTAKKDDPLKF